MCSPRAIMRYCAITVLILLKKTQSNSSRVVKIESGYVRGYKDGYFHMYTFYSIPYATAPTGRNKFKAPLPAPVWLDTFEAVDRGIICPQNHVFEGKTQKEDCLIANVYVPNTYETSLPVLVDCHPGGYQYGFGTRYTIKHLVHSKRIIVVSFNYRLSAHGFLCLGTKDVPGNAGMKDHVALLHWVKRNIARFGGNPDDVTIRGFSAGSNSVSLLTLSKMARGLFSKVVAESGSSVSVWGMQISPVETAFVYAEKRGFNKSNDIYALEEFYKNLNLEKLNDDFAYNDDFTFWGFVPCVERPTGDGGGIMFLDDAPLHIIKSGDYPKLPTLMSISPREFDPRFSFNKFELPKDLQFKKKKEKQKLIQKISKFYSNYKDYVSDIWYTYSMLREVKLHIEAGHNKLYFLEAGYPKHCGQSFTIIDDKNERENTLSKESKRAKAVLREILLNFATAGNPVRQGSGMPAWGPVVSTEGAPHMVVVQGAAPRMRGSSPQAARARFWHAVYDEHYRPPQPPPEPAVVVMQRVFQSDYLHYADVSKHVN